MNARRALAIALAAVALSAAFAIGLLVGREIARPAAVAASDGQPLYDLGPYAEVDPGLLAWRLLVEVPVALSKPTGIASLSDGAIAVCGDRSLLVVDRTGAVLERWDFAGEPTCVAAGPKGAFYLGLPDHVEVARRGTAGTAAWPGLGPRAIVTSIAVVGSDVFVADAGNRMVMRFSADGRLTGKIGGDFVVPSPFFDVAAAPDGTLWVVDPGRRTVRHFSCGGGLLASWGFSSLDIEGFSGCCNPVHAAVCACGSLITAEKGLPRIKAYEPHGTLASVVAGPSDLPPNESGLDLATRDANSGEVLVLVPSERAVRVYVKKEDVGG